MSSTDSDHDLLHATDADVDAVLAEFGGNARAAIKALLHDLALLAGDYEKSVSRGFVRGDIPRAELKRKA